MVVNATSLGMGPGDALPLRVPALKPGMMAAEIVTYPETTAYLGEAGRRGCELHYGRPMLAAQIDLTIEFMRA
jgi:shikimate dehydrogenase